MDSVDAAAVVTASPNKPEPKVEELKRKSNGDAATVEAEVKNGKEDEPVVKKVKLVDSVSLTEKGEPETEAEPDESGDKSNDKSGDKLSEKSSDKSSDEVEAELNGEKSKDGEVEVNESDEEDESEVNGSNGDKQDLPKDDTAEPEAAEESKE
ncbi:hypothetical protein D915_011031 [Fasciola hepatica]|uniref:Uncharacterized protein n=1 Tax=Fasciola hepatica TaxID=6192 RepID=A0A2H1BT74_FASHE|nr:hypothetical protein D915_011031 [Fasciola hepatica]